MAVKSHGVSELGCSEENTSSLSILKAGSLGPHTFGESESYRSRVKFFLGYHYFLW